MELTLRRACTGLRTTYSAREIVYHMENIFKTINHIVSHLSEILCLLLIDWNLASGEDSICLKKNWVRDYP